MKSIINFIKGVLISCWVVLAIFTTICLISYNDYKVSVFGDYSLFIVDNKELEPTFKKYDVVISNPPYIKTNEEIEDIVRNNEPHLALFAGVDGLDCYRNILNNVKEHLKEKYLIAFEIGYTQANDIKALAQQVLPKATIEVKKDLSEKDRMIFIYN